MTPTSDRTLPWKSFILLLLLAMEVHNYGRMSGEISMMDMCATLSTRYASEPTTTALMKSSMTSSPTPTPENKNTNDADYSKAHEQSLGFFKNIPSSEWKLLQEKVSAMSPNFDDNMFKTSLSRRKNKIYGYFWQHHYEPDFVCQHERRVGKRGDGGKWICDPHRIAQKVEAGGRCLIYSVGSFNNYKFEQGVQKDVHEKCEIHTFDPGDYESGAKKAGGDITYHRVGVSTDKVGPKGIYKSLPTLVSELGHQNSEIDVFKIDCEGCEFESASNWFEASAKYNVTLRQILVELHGRKEARVFSFFDLMYKHGYVIFHKEQNTIAMNMNGTAIEYAFLKLDPAFVNAIPRANAYETFRTMTGE
ncbi:unnamed protein product [Pseudo-nitzschia multistriata]|uniref:Methyltransferase domain-containing protein n=1 Tax=Pseudo-nitzschia multistriata TaxID=183589 RepID=A0A448Z1Y4_9STRA|nr:unnamed protein product [Pseudo-nitzschia multistriata]